MRIIHCKRCGIEVATNSSRTLFCKPCSIINDKESVKRARAKYRDPAYEKGKPAGWDRDFSHIEARDAQKWHREGYQPNELSVLLQRNPKVIKQMLETPLTEKDEMAIEKYFNPGRCRDGIIYSISSYQGREERVG